MNAEERARRDQDRAGAVVRVDASVGRVPGVGLEPTRPFGHGSLSAACLPFHHPGPGNDRTDQRLPIFLPR